MKVSDVMQKHVEYVSSDTKVLDVARIIFGRRINGLPVCDGKKVLGFITDTDILSKFHPTMQEFIEDPFASADFESMEEKAKEILELTAKDVMSKRPIIINKDDPIMRADSTMRLHDVGRLPVVDHKGDLVGIISMGDIFKSLVGKKMPYLESEEYHDWIAQHFDMAMGWESRLPAEIPPLVDLFKKNNIKKVIDIGCGTGSHVIELAKNGFEVLGLESSQLMFNTARDKWRDLPKTLQNKVKFIKGDYIEILKRLAEEYDATIFMGNAFSHIPYTYMQVLEKLNSVLSKKKGLIVIQLANTEKEEMGRSGMRRFAVKQSKISPERKHAYLWFFDSFPQKEGETLMLNAAIFDFDGKIWTVRGTNRVATMPFSRKTLKKLFDKYGFTKISFTGSTGSEPILKNEFKVDKSDWLIMVAKR